MSLDALLQRLPITVAAFVEGTPSVTADGALVLGSRHTHAFLVDIKTGKLIKSYVEYGGPLGHNASLTGKIIGISSLSSHK